jgi:hypothetical protein
MEATGFIAHLAMWQLTEGTPVKGKQESRQSEASPAASIADITKAGSAVMLSDCRAGQRQLPHSPHLHHPVYPSLGVKPDLAHLACLCV